jgi:hypothetical protein
MKTIEGPWEVFFDPNFGGPKNITFDKLQDWTQHEKRGIKYYSGIATYKNTFNFNPIGNGNTKYYLDLGVVYDMARVKLNGKDVGVVWCAPWKIEISHALKTGENFIEIEVANRWINRLLGDSQAPDANVRKVRFDNGLMAGKEYLAGRYTFTTSSVLRGLSFIKQPLSSGLLGPVNIEKVRYHDISN